MFSESNFYCIFVKTGLEKSFINEVQPMLDSSVSVLKEKLYFFKKQMRLKSGKQYTDPVFPSYVFFETDAKTKDFSLLRKGKGFIHLLPQGSKERPLEANDLEILKSILKYGTVIPIVHVEFDVNDRIQLLDGPFKDMTGKVTAVNRRNKRVNLNVEFMNGVRLIGLTYE